jgi:hypothetical protein
MRAVEWKKILPRDYPRQHHYMRVSEMSGYSLGDDLSGVYYPAAEVDAYRRKVAALVAIGKQLHALLILGANEKRWFPTTKMTDLLADLKATLAALGEDGG